MDSKAFKIIEQYGCYPPEFSVENYAQRIRRFATCGNLLAAVAQDYMCEPQMLERTGLTIDDHQRLTIERYDALLACDTAGIYIMPVLQGYAPQDYVRHLHLYGVRLKPGAWTGVGSVCKRNGDPAAIEAVMMAIKQVRPDLKLHGFGLKLTALGSGLVRGLLHTADSMAWSYAARRQHGNGNDWRAAAAFAKRIDDMPYQGDLLAAILSA